MLDTGLRGQDVQQLALPDAPGQGAERSVGACMAVADGHGQAWQDQALLRSDHMDDAMTGFTDFEVAHAMTLRVFSQRDDMRIEALQRIMATRIGGHRVIRGREGQLRMTQRPTTLSQTTKGAAVEVWQHMAINMQQGKALAQVLHDVAMPDLLEQRARHGLSC